MSRLISLLVVLSIGGCDYIYPLGKCHTSDVGCELPGEYRLVSIDGEAATGSLQINSGQFDRDGYLDLPTGDEQYPRLLGPFFGQTELSSLQDEDPERYDLDVSMELSPPARITADLKTSASVDGDRLTLRVRSLRARHRVGAGWTNLTFPKLSTEAELVFRRM